jgi:hypothetical protein
MRSRARTRAAAPAGAAGARGRTAPGVGPGGADGLCYTRDMAIKRLDHVSVVDDDLAAAVAFFTALGMTKEGEAPVEGPWVDRVNGLEGVQVKAPHRKRWGFSSV